MKIDQDLQALTKAFDDRHDWWEKTVARADAAQARHFAAYKKAAIRQQEVEDVAHGLKRAADIAQGGTASYPGNIAPLYSTCATLKDSIEDPLDGIGRTGKISRKMGKFWNKYSKLMQQGRYGAAEDMLADAHGGFFKSTWRKLRYNNLERAEWADEIERAKKNLKKYEDKCIKLDRVRSDIAYGEKIISKTLYKMLKDKSVQDALREPSVAALAQKSPTLAFLTQYAKNDFKMTKEDIARDLSATQGAVTIAEISRQLSGLHRQAPNVLRVVIQNSLTARDRYEKAKDFAESARVAQRLETKTSMLADGLYSDLRQRLKESGTLVDSEKIALLAAAKEKKKRWIDPGIAEKNIALLEKDDFNPSEIGRMPWAGYAINMMKAAIPRVATVPVKALSAIFTGSLFEQAWNSSSSGKGGGGQNIPPSSPSQQTTPRQNVRTGTPPGQKPPTPP